MVYLYHKIGMCLDAFDFVFIDIGICSDVIAVSENAYSFRELDNLIRDGRAGDALAVRDLSDLGAGPDDILRRLDLIMPGVFPLWIGALPASYAGAFDMSANRSVLGLLVYGLRAGMGGTMLKTPVGRPEVRYPDGWEDMYFDWKAGKLSAKEFLVKSGLKKATFYNRLSDYSPVYEMNLLYRSRYDIA